MTDWPKDSSTQAKMTFYGDFRKKGWEAANLISLVPPFQLYYDKHPIKSIRVHKLIMPAVLAAFTDIGNQCGFDQAKLDKTGITDYAGSYNVRAIAGSNPQRWSNHSWAAALDFSPATNGFNMKSTLSAIVPEAFKRQGAKWGGDYKGRKDPMHFEFVS